MKHYVLVLTTAGCIIAIASVLAVLCLTIWDGPETAGASSRGSRSVERRSRSDEGSRDADRDRPRERESSRESRNESQDQGYELRESALASDLQTIRSMIELYRVQHMENYPGTDCNGRFDGELFVAQLTKRTDANGNVLNGGERGLDFPFGPYLQKFPANPFVIGSAAWEVSGGSGPAPGDGSTGWYFDATTGTFSPNDQEHTGL